MTPKLFADYLNNIPVGCHFGQTLTLNLYLLDSQNFTFSNIQIFQLSSNLFFVFQDRGVL